MTKIAEYGHFKRKKITQKELTEFQQSIDENYEGILKKKIQQIYHDAGIEVNLDNIFF